MVREFKILTLDWMNNCLHLSRIFFSSFNQSSPILDQNRLSRLGHVKTIVGSSIFNSGKMRLNAIIVNFSQNYEIVPEMNKLNWAYRSLSYHNKPELLFSQSLSSNIHFPPEAILAVLLHKTGSE